MNNEGGLHNSMSMLVELSKRKIKVTDEMVCRAIEAMTNPIVECCDCYVCKESMRAALEAALGEK